MWKRDRENMVDLIYKDEVYAIIGAAIEVHKVLGCGFLEPIYQEALEVELTARKIPYESQKELQVYYKEQPLQKLYIADFIACDKIIIEIKALTRLSGIEESQLLNYLKATGLEVG
jgi:GxxExxY protein